MTSQIQHSDDCDLTDISSYQWRIRFSIQIISGSVMSLIKLSDDCNLTDISGSVTSLIKHSDDCDLNDIWTSDESDSAFIWLWFDWYRLYQRQVWIQHSDDRDLTDISGISDKSEFRIQMIVIWLISLVSVTSLNSACTMTIIYCEGCVCSPLVSICCFALACKENMTATLWGLQAEHQFWCSDLLKCWYKLQWYVSRTEHWTLHNHKTRVHWLWGGFA